MKIIWALEKIENRDFEKQVKYLESSVKGVLEIYPDSIKTLYLDKESKNTLFSLGLLKCFDEVNEVNYEYCPYVKSDVFWASVKFRVFRQQEEPFLFLDNDFIIKSDILRIIPQDRICFTHVEYTRMLYPNPISDLVRSLHLPYRNKNYAANPSFLYAPDTVFIKEYAETALTLLEELSLRNIQDSTYMLFVEQQGLYAQICKYALNYTCLIKQIQESMTGTWTGHIDNNGIWSAEESKIHFYHPGPSK